MQHFTRTLVAVFLTIVTGVAFSQNVTFTNSSAQLGAITGFSYEDCAVDMNGDYLDDVVRVTGTGIFIDYQLPEGGFEQTYHPLLVQNPPNWSICAGDLDKNGYNDLLFGNGSRVSFVYADNNGASYSELPHDEYIFSQRSTMADLNNDGHLDAFVCHDVDMSHPYRNDGAGNLTLDFSLIQTIDAGGNYAAVWCDYDNDGDIDLHIAKCRGGAPYGNPQRVNGLYRNNGDGTFTEVGAAANMNDSNQSWTTVFEDFDNDGWFDAFTVNHASGDVPGGARNKLMHNNGDGTFTDIIDDSGIIFTDLGAWNCDAGDFNNDGFVDIHSELDQSLYLNNGDGTFTGTDIPFTSGGIGDLNGDGFLDAIRGNTLWINNGNENNYIIFSFEGIFSNHNGIGSRVEIYGDWGIQVREVRSGTSFSPMKSLNAHFGLGQATSVDSVVVKWPSGVVTTIPNPQINTINHIPESNCILASTPITVEGGIAQICAGSSVTLTAAAGFDQYLWNNGAQTQSIEVSSGGIYSASLTDADGCISVSEQVFIEELPEDNITLSTLGDLQFCEGGSVMISASYGTNFEWSNGATTQTIEATVSGIYYVEAMGACSETISDSIIVNVVPAPAPMVEDVLLNEPGTATISATGESILWYETEDATEPIGSGNVFETPFITESVQFWAEATYQYGGQLETGGKVDNSGGGGIPSTGAYSYFNVWEPFTLLDVRVYVPAGAGAGVRDVQLVDGNDNVLATASFDLTEGEHVLELNFEVPEGEGFTLRCPQNDLFRNYDATAVIYPYAIGTVGELYDSYYGPNYYYYFYDWHIQKSMDVCVSERVSVSILFTGIGDELESSALQVFPNPVVNEFQFSFSSEGAAKWTFELFEISGKRLWSAENITVSNEYITSVDVRKFPAGVYYLKVSGNDGTLTKKIVVQ